MIGVSYITRSLSELTQMVSMCAKYPHALTLLNDCRNAIEERDKKIEQLEAEMECLRSENGNLLGHKIHKPGQWVRVNCPLWRGPKKEGE